MVDICLAKIEKKRDRKKFFLNAPKRTRQSSFSIENLILSTNNNFNSHSFLRYLHSQTDIGLNKKTHN